MMTPIRARETRMAIRLTILTPSIVDPVMDARIIAETIVAFDDFLRNPKNSGIRLTPAVASAPKKLVVRWVKTFSTLIDSGTIWSMGFSK